MSALTKEAVEYGYEPELELEKEKYRKLKKKRVIKEKKKNKILINVKTTFMITVFFLLGAYTIYNYSVITDKKMELAELESEITDINNEIDKYNVALESVKNTDKVEAAARVLGLSYPSAKQTVYIDVAYEEEQPVENAAAEGNGSKILAFIDKIIQLIQ